jgi:O-6-methylguanine DNA methyltransferase
VSLTLETAAYASPLGTLTLVEGPDGPLVVGFPGRSGRLHWQLRVRGAAPEVRTVEGPCQVSADFLDRYFAGELQHFRYPAYLARWFDVSEAQALVSRELCRIPFGETRTYGEIAKATGLHPRLVGQLVGANQLAILVPCHRVVGARGALVGYGGGLQRKRWLLAHEVRHSRSLLRREG